MNKLEEREARRKRSIIGRMIDEEQEEQNPNIVIKNKGKDRIQRAYWLDKDLEKSLKRKALEEGKSLTESVNEALRRGLSDYL